MSNIGIFILDSTLEPVPIGLPGEIHIAGIALGRGYHNRPDLTAEKFLPSPFSRDRGGRMYKTGDVGRFRTDGAIEFVGRIDNQVKVRGYRIELGEIEAILKSHPNVADCAVVLRDDADGERKIVAYVASGTGEEPTPAELKTYVRELIPEYMVPATIVLMKSMPLTVNGKLDRSALPAPDDKRPEIGEARVAPRNDGERKLARIWSQLLGLNDVGVRDNFFNIGGHSLLGIELLSEVRNQFGIKLPLSVLFEAPTIEGLLNALEKAQGSQIHHREPAITRASRDAYRGRRSDSKSTTTTRVADHGDV
jgi:acyl carrier protein